MTDSLPAEVVRWSVDEMSRIRRAYGSAIKLSAVDSGAELLMVSDPAGGGWAGTARLTEVRTDADSVEFTVFFSATPPLARRPAVHLCGLDLRDDGQRVHVSMDTPWVEIRTGDGPTLRGGIDRLIRGNFRPSLAHVLAQRTVMPYG
ncbi:hypothetical protein [Cellulomonas sp. ATA003]|uniref:hypothetical protein n=1 Tax=Cellulomonas sp. ATA003 TaxID=3073064 RepID=UPI002873808B|nr:hypothetical protein [Cellulomonas sp. ATA003]WNB86538.1 hypothetical protein REH70_04700 [Cellulomonas sp. ATA003]